MSRAGRTQAGSLLRPRTKRTRRPRGGRGIRWGRPGDEGARTGRRVRRAVAARRHRPRGAGMSVVMRKPPGNGRTRGPSGGRSKPAGRRSGAPRPTALATVTARRSRAQRGTDQCLHREETQVVRARLRRKRPAPTATKRPRWAFPCMLRASSRCTAVLKMVQMAKATRWRRGHRPGGARPRRERGSRAC